MSTSHPPGRRRTHGAPLLTAASVSVVSAVLLALLVVPSGWHGTRSSGGRDADAGGAGPAVSTGPSAGSTTGASPSGTPTSDASGRPGEPGAVDPSTAPTRIGSSSTPLLIGVAVPDLSVVRSLGPAYDLGPVEKQFEATAAAYRSRHQLPTSGRDIRFVFRSFNVLDESDQRRVCTQLVDDDHVFAVVSIFLFLSGAACTSAEKHVPTITLDSFSKADLRAAAPYLFSVAPAIDRVLRHQADWMIANGLVKGHKVGLYYPSTPDTLAKLVRDQFIATLRARGYDLAAEVTTSDGSAGGPTDAVAVQRFRSAGVDVAVLLVSPLAKSNFLQSAQTQHYSPTQVTSDVAVDTTTAAASAYPKGAFDGAWGMTAARSGEIEAGIVAPRAASCLADYRRATGRGQPDPHSGELSSVLGVCDVMDVLLAGLTGAGPSITRRSLMSALPRVERLSLAGNSRLDYAPGKYDGLNQVRTVRWHADCTCWKAIGTFEELPR